WIVEVGPVDLDPAGVAILEVTADKDVGRAFKDVGHKPAAPTARPPTPRQPRHHLIAILRPLEVARLDEHIAFHARRPRLMRYQECRAACDLADHPDERVRR